MNPIEDHDRGLAHDLKTIAAMTDRRRALRWFAGVGTAVLVAACDGGSASGTSSSSTGTATPTPTPTPSSTPTPTASATATPAGTGTCIVDPTETGGPYPADGTNSARGSTSNVLTSSGIVRSDIRASFLGSTTVAPGVPVTITLTVVDVKSTCAPLAGYAVYLWHCNRDGDYSLYDVPAESYLRGVLVTDANGQVTFTTIFPACYAGRYPHMHFEVFSSLANATGGRYAVLTSQLAMPAAACSAVYASTGYETSVSRFAQVSIANDNVFGDNSAAQVAQQTPAASGSVSAGYTMAATIGVAR